MLSECVSGRACSQCDNSGTGCPTCAAETAAAAAARLTRSKASQLMKRAQGWHGPRVHNPSAQGRVRTSFAADARKCDLPAAAAADTHVEPIEGGAIVHMLQRLQHPLLHHCEAVAIMRQLSSWLASSWAHSSDPAGDSCSAQHCNKFSNSPKLLVFSASTSRHWARAKR